MSKTEFQDAVMKLSATWQRYAAQRGEELDLVQVEREVQEGLNKLGRVIMGHVLASADTKVETLEFEGARWGARRESAQEYMSIFGPLKVTRSIYQKAGGGPVLVPLDVRLGIVEKRYTPRVARLMTLGISFMPAEECARYLVEAGVAQVGKATLSRIPLDIAARYETRRQEINEVLRQAEEVPDGATLVQVGLDGVMVPQDGEDAAPRGRKAATRTEARHERHYGVTYPNAPNESDAIEGRAWHEASVGTLGFWNSKGELLHTIYVAQMPESGMATLHDELRRELATVLTQRQDLKVQLASDGDVGQWRYLKELAAELAPEVGTVSQCLDFFHAAEYVHRATALVWGADTPESRVRASTWLTIMKEHDDGALRVIKAMRHQRANLRGKSREALDRIVKYLAKHEGAGHMRYAQAKRVGEPIGTGITEAAAKTLVGTRMKRAGARFSQHGGQTILLFRAAEKSGRFERISSAIEDTYRRDMKCAA